MSQPVNRVIGIAMIILVLVGLCFSVSTSYWADESGNTYRMLWKQLLFVGVGTFAAIVCRYTSEKLLSQYYILLYIIGVVGVLLCYTPLGVTANGAQRWIGVGGFTLQTSEFAKITTIIALASWYKFNASKVTSFVRGFVVPSTIIGIPFVTIFAQTDMGTALALGFTGLIIMILAGASFKWILPTLLSGALLVSLIVSLNGNRMSRITHWQMLDKQEHRIELLQGSGRQQQLARDGMREGALLGVGFAKGAENKREDLPYAHTDFVFAIICEELGFLGAFFVILLFGTIAVCGLIITGMAETLYDRVLAGGAVSMLIVPALINMMVVSGILPNSGLPLPFISYGGSSLISSIIAIGLLTRAGRTVEATQTIISKQRRINIPLSAIGVPQIFDSPLSGDEFVLQNRGQQHTTRVYQTQANQVEDSKGNSL